MLRIRTYFMVAVMAVLTGCAGSAGSYKMTAVAPVPVDKTALSNLQINVEPGEGIALDKVDTNRLVGLIITRIRDMDKDRFHDINSPGSDLGKMLIEVKVKRYDEGSAFKRFIVAGWGSIHIDADVYLRDAKTHNLIEQYEVTKTFAWGGFYGSFTSIKGVEEGFAKAIAEVIIGEK